MIANHRSGIVAGQLPHGQYTTLLGFEQQGVDEVAIELRIDNGHQGMIGTEGVPEGEDGINRTVDVALVYLVVHAEVASVGIGKEVGLHTGMVESRVEDGALVGVVGRNVNLAQVVVPTLTGLTLHAFKIPIGQVSLQVATGSFGIHSRDGQLNQHLFILLGSEVKQGLGRGEQLSSLVEGH